MLRTNLATRPFYNERAVHLALASVAAIVLLLTLYNVTTIVTLTGRQRALTDAATRDEQRAAQLTQQAAALQRSLNATELSAVAAAAHEANTIIDRRTFSWTELFNVIETTLPEDVMLTSIKPDIEKGEAFINMIVLGRRVEDIDTFMEKLEGAGAFSNVLSLAEERVEESGMYKAALRGRYHSASTATAARPPIAEKPKAVAE